MTAEELQEELRFAVDAIMKYINDYSERALRESKDTSRAYDQGCVHGCYHALTYIRRLIDEDESETDQEIEVLTLADIHD